MNLQSLNPADIIMQENCLHSIPLQDNNNTDQISVQILDENECLMIDSKEKFLKQLNIEPTQKIKVVSIFGNTGDGKSYTLNHTFFNGEKIFRTSPSQSSCTIGVWAMFDKEHNVLCFDTEGLLGISNKEKQRTRLLLKILAVSDIIIYKTRSERLHKDMYTFLYGASEMYKQQFKPALEKLLKHDDDKMVSSLGPGLIIFHQTLNTDTLNDSHEDDQTPEHMIRREFDKLKLNYDSFSSIRYLGFKNNDKAAYSKLLELVLREVQDTTIRSPRIPEYIFKTLKNDFLFQAFNDKFQSELRTDSRELCFSAYFTCHEKCLSCGGSCCLSMGHKDEKEPHRCKQPCKYQHQYENQVYYCKYCYNAGNHQEVKQSSQTEQSWTGLLSYAWSGFVITCPQCGDLYKSRQYWYGNKKPEECAVKQEIVHVWQDSKSFLGSQNSAQRILDTITRATEVISNVASEPAKAVGDWMADTVAPSYWKPNHEITKCYKCGLPFLPTAKKHHCRKCGEGFCDKCSSKKQVVPERGWYSDVRVCDDCYLEQPPTFSGGSDTNDVRARIVGETVVNTMCTVKSYFEIPKDIIKETVRPSYWTPDSECKECVCCKKEFGPHLLLHHCRDCGKGVCDDCSDNRKCVPSRGWNEPVRVCNNC